LISGKLVNLDCELEELVKNVGLWIDHHKAIMVTIENEREKTQEINSNMEEHIQFSNGTPSTASRVMQESNAEDVWDGQRGAQLESYFDGIISLIRDAESIWIFGPGEAKVELENRFKRDGLGARIVGIETVGIMTAPQISTKVRKLFQTK